MAVLVDEDNKWEAFRVLNAEGDFVGEASSGREAKVFKMLAIGTLLGVALYALGVIR